MDESRGASEWLTLPAPLVVPFVVLLLNKSGDKPSLMNNERQYAYDKQIISTVISGTYLSMPANQAKIATVKHSK